MSFRHGHKLWRKGRSTCPPWETYPRGFSKRTHYATHDLDAKGASIARGRARSFHGAIVITIASWSAGVDSTAMVLAILRGMHPDIKRLDELVMSDTGSEKRRSIDFLHEFSAWMGARFPTIPITVLSFKDNRWLHYKPLHEYCLEEGHERLPSRRLRWCTDKAKIQPITHYLKRTYPKRKVTVLIGFESTEGCRVQRGRNRVLEFQNRFPLADLGMDRKDCEDLIRSVGLWVPPKSACFMCPFMKTREVREMAQNEPDRFDMMLRMERVVNERRRREGKSGFYFKHKPLTELVQGPQPGTQTLF